MSSRLGVLVLAVAVAALGVAAYALTRAQTARPAAPGPKAAVEAALSDIETRLAAIESKLREEPAPPNLDPAILDRIARLERRLKALPETASLPPTVEDPKASVGGEPDDAQVARFKKLQDAARRQEWAKRVRKRVDSVLAGLEIQLSGKQTAQLAESWGEFQPRIDEIWGEAKRGGVAAGQAVDWKRIISDTTALIEREFTEIVLEFLPAGDAERIAAGLVAAGK